MSIFTVSQALSLIIQCATIITLIYTLAKFASKPRADLTDRVEDLEDWKKAVDARLASGNDHFTQIDDSNRYTQEALLALLENAIDGNHKEKLKEAKDNLQSYLINK